MFDKFSRWLTCVLTLVCSLVGMSMSVFALNPIMGDETQGTVKLMTILLIVSAVLIVALVGLSALKKKGNKKTKRDMKTEDMRYVLCFFVIFFVKGLKQKEKQGNIIR